jgi:L-ascorbate metabolism protein UlaG (beta-lactamase superfamily)
MGAFEAAALTREIDPKRVVPMHYGVMVDNDADPYTFLEALATNGANAVPKVLAIGESWLVSF